MDPISGAIGMIAAIPQCIEAAKQLYDLRERFDRAAILITAIYTESMVVAASLSQIQSLLQQGTTLQNKPELRDTLDRALTGCWVVYQCLEEEVRDLTGKVDVNDLRKRDRARFLLKEANFKELLQQIRGQQSALGLLIQGLQMESLSDMHRLIGDNSLKLDQIAKRSNTLRQKHPNIKVPESLLEKDGINDTQSIFGDAEFTFDDEVINSKAYRRAMARAITGERAKDPKNDVEIIEGEFIDLDTIRDEQHDDHMVGGATADMKSLMLQIDDAIDSHNETPPPYEDENEDEGAHAEMLDDLEKSMLPFMPPGPSPRPSVVITETESSRTSPPTRESTSTLVTSVIEENSDTGPISALKTNNTDRAEKAEKTEKTDETEETEEKPPPLPPRRTPPFLLAPERTDSSSELKKVSSWEEIFSPLSNTSSLSLTDPSSTHAVGQSNQMIPRKPSPLLVKKPSNISIRSPSNENTSIPSRVEDDPKTIWATILTEEEKYIERMNKFQTTFYDSIVKQWPVLEKHMEAIVVAGKLIPLHQEHIADVIREQITQQPSATCDARLFITWASKAYRLLKEYSQRYPHALYALRLTQNTDKKFSPHIHTFGLSLAYFGKSWEDYLLLPIQQLDRYVSWLQSLTKHAEEDSTPVPIKEEAGLKGALYVLRRLRKQCNDLVEQSETGEQLQRLYRRIHTADTGLVDVLELLSPIRRIVHQGSLAIKLNGHSTWQSVHAVLLDNYLLWGKTKSPKTWKHQERKGDSISVIEQPIPVSHMAIRMPVNPQQTRKTSYLDELPRGVTLYELFVDVVVTRSIFSTYVLAPLSLEERNTWYRKLSGVVGTKPPDVPT